jgi:hypothetical protein
MPNVFHHNLLRDFVCDVATYHFLDDTVRSKLHVVAQGRCGESDLVVLQVTSVFDVVDASNSIKSEFDNMRLAFPHVPPDKEAIVRGNFFRVPNQGLSLKVLVADDVETAIVNAGIRGWRFTPATVSD